MSPALVPIVRTVASQAGSGHLQHDGELAVDEKDADDEDASSHLSGGLQTNPAACRQHLFQ